MYSVFNMNKSKELPEKIEELVSMLHHNMRLLQSVTENLTQTSNTLLELFQDSSSNPNPSFFFTYTLRYLRYAYCDDPEGIYELLTCNLYTKTESQLQKMIQALSFHKKPLKEAREKVLLEYLQENPHMNNEIVAQILCIENFAVVQRFLSSFYKEWKHYLNRSKRGRYIYISWKNKKEETL